MADWRIFWNLLRKVGTLMTKKEADWAKEESPGDTQDILNRLKESAENDHYWCELSSYSSSLLWQELQRRHADEPSKP